MQPFVHFLLSAALILPFSAAQAAEKWEICLDKADFTFNLDGFVGSTSVSKSQCSMKFGLSGGKGEKFEVDLCDTQIQIKHFPTLDTVNPNRFMAGSAVCPKPLFGADYDENSQDIQDYKEKKRRVFEIWESVKEVYGEGADAIDLSNPKSFSPEVSAGKIACGNFLLKEYLQRCMAFESKKSAPVKDGAPPPIPGVHPQTILVPKTKP